MTRVAFVSRPITTSLARHYQVRYHGTCVSRPRDAILGRADGVVSDVLDAEASAAVLPSRVLQPDTGQGYASLVAVARHASQDSWDGYGGKRVEPASINHARHFLGILPEGTPTPEIGTSPRGTITFDWYFEARWILSVSVGSANEFSYAALLDSEKVHGRAPLEGTLSPTVVHLLRRVLGGRP